MKAKKLNDLNKCDAFDYTNNFSILYFHKQKGIINKNNVGNAFTRVKNVIA